MKNSNSIFFAVVAILLTCLTIASYLSLLSKISKVEETLGQHRKNFGVVATSINFLYSQISTSTDPLLTGSSTSTN